MDLLAAVDMHGIQTSGNCIRNITSDELAGVAPDEIVDPRPYCEILRQWSTLHPEFAFLPRKFKIAVTGAREDRAATALARHRPAAAEERGRRGRLPACWWAAAWAARRSSAPWSREFLPWQQILCYIEAVVRVYNRYGRRDNMYKARIKILVKAEGQRFVEDGRAPSSSSILERDAGGAAHLIPQAELDRVARHFVPPARRARRAPADDDTARSAATSRWPSRAGSSATCTPHRVPGYRAVTLSLKRAGQAPGDATADQMDAAAELADRFSPAKLRVTHDQNLVLPWVRAERPARAVAGRAQGRASPRRTSAC